MKKKVSMQDIADHVGVSKNAVSLALSGKPGVSEETRDLVFKMAGKLGYAGIAGKEISSNKILVLVPEYIRNDSFFYNDIYWAVENRAKQKNCIAILATVSEEMQRKEELPSIFYEMEFAGIITIGILTVEYVSFLCRQTEHIVSVDQSYNSLPVDCVVTANLEGAYEITRLALDYGHRKLGFVGSIEETSSLFERYCGFQRAMMEEKLEGQSEFNILTSSPLNILLSSPDELVAILNTMECFPTAWICGGDRIAIALIEALKRIGLRVPEDVSVLGFDDLEVSSIINPPLTTVAVNRKQLGYSAIDRFLQMIKSKPDYHSKYCIMPRMVIRDSLKKRA